MNPTVLASVADEGGGLQIPTVADMFQWPNFLFDGTPFAMNKVGALYLLAALISFILWIIPAKNGKIVPRGLQSMMEPLYEFIRNNIAVEVMGPAGVKYVPLLGTLFTFILIANLFEITPLILFPPMANIALPALLAVSIWIIFQVQGVISQGPFKYYKGVLVPQGVPGFLAPLVALIEFVSTLLVRPFSLAVRLFANMVAGHVLVTMMLVFSTYTLGGFGGGGWFSHDPFVTAVFIPSFIGAVIMLGFEIFVSFIQAFIFTMLAAVYIGDAMHAH